MEVRDGGAKDRRGDSPHRVGEKISLCVMPIAQTTKRYPCHAYGWMIGTMYAMQHNTPFPSTTTTSRAVSRVGTVTIRRGPFSVVVAVRSLIMIMILMVVCHADQQQAPNNNNNKKEPQATATPTLDDPPRRRRFPRFHVLGPVITMTLKDPSASNTNNNNQQAMSSPSVSTATTIPDKKKKKKHQQQQQVSPHRSGYYPPATIPTTSSSSFRASESAPSLVILKTLISSIRPKATWSLEWVPTKEPPEDAFPANTTTTNSQDASQSTKGGNTATPSKSSQPPKQPPAEQPQPQQSQERSRTWMPTLEQVYANLTYDYPSLAYFAPTDVQTTCQFRTRVGDVWFQPRWNLATHETEWDVSVSRGTSFVLTRLGGRRRRRPVGESMDGTGHDSDHEAASVPLPWIPRLSLKSLVGSFTVALPDNKAIHSLRFRPQIDFTSSYADVSCQVHASCGPHPRDDKDNDNDDKNHRPPTQAILNLDYTNPTLTVVHPINEWNTVSPSIAIYTARITYQWHVKLTPDGSSSLTTKIDPLDAITMTWTDPCQLGGGSWVADVRLPIGGSWAAWQSPAAGTHGSSSWDAWPNADSGGGGGLVSALATALTTDIRIRRQFKF